MDRVKPASPDAPGPVNILQTPLEGWEAARVEGNRFAGAPPGMWGVVASDFYYRPVVTIPCVKGPGSKSWTPLAICELPGKPARIVTALRLADLSTGWQRAKYLRALAAARLDIGGSSLKGPQATLQGNTDELYPEVWLEGFVHPYSHWRW